jgi:hypothetical protein
MYSLNKKRKTPGKPEDNFFPRERLIIRHDKLFLPFPEA